jgi:hypothetical protein
MTDRRITVTVTSRGAGGNIYAILGEVQRAMRKAGLITAYNDLRDDILNSGSYEAAIARIRRTVDLVDTSKEI